MKKIFFILFLLSILCFKIKTSPQLKLNPDTIITNNNVVNYHDSIQNLNNEIREDNFNYIFKKEEITENLSQFKIDYISNIHNHISNKNYDLALEYLNKFFYLFSNDTQILSLREYLTNINKDTQLINYTGDIEILSFNPIISFPNSALDHKNSFASKVDENNITCNEFEKILLSLYEKNYILISSNLLNNYRDKTLLLPKNKKPLILILEDVEYNTKAHGSVERLILDNNNQIATYTPKQPINDRIGHNNDFITILEEFVNTHPSFSLNNARAAIVIDGSRGIFGYNTQKTNTTSKYQIKKVIELISILKTKGYTFISEGYQNSFTDEPMLFANSLNRWKEYIEPILESNTNIFFLNSPLKNSNKHTENLELLKSYHYSIIIGSEMDSKAKIIDDLLYLPARQINGKTLRYSQSNLMHLFDCEYVYDHINRHITYST